MQYWLLLADPKAYGFSQLERDRKTVWDGISGSLAQKHMRTFRVGDRALIYHTAPDKAVVGKARVTSGPYADPKDKTGKLVVVEIEAAGRFKKAVPLESLRKSKKLSGMAFLKIQRIAISPVTKQEFDEIVKMGTPA